eukprot:GEMP01007931.1.p1 GENE.GEMP01007931.1~~GEMP01007931.1.p1  ORF type:complete len:764 (+),score=157.80 GEMP01007931.1:233-2524(+)
MPRARGLTFESFSRNVHTWVWGFGSPDDGNAGDVPYGPTCVICNDEYQAGSIVCKIQTCDHTFHHQCITQWWARSTRCPVCNNNLGSAHRFRVSSERSLGSASLSLSRSSSNADSIRSGLVLVGYSNSDPQLIRRSRSYYDIHSILGTEDMERLRENILARSPVATPLRESRSESSLPRLPYGPVELLSSSPSWNMLPLDDRLQPVEELADEFQPSARGANRELDSIHEAQEIHDVQHSARRTPSLAGGPTSPAPGSAVPSGSLSHVGTPLASAVGVAHLAPLVAASTMAPEGAPGGPMAPTAGQVALLGRLEILASVPQARVDGMPRADRSVERTSARGQEAEVDEAESTAHPVSTISPRGGTLLNGGGLQHKQYPQHAAPIERTFFCSLPSSNAPNRIVAAFPNFRVAVPHTTPLRSANLRLGGDARYAYANNDMFSLFRAAPMESFVDNKVSSNSMGSSGDMSMPLPGGAPPPVRRSVSTAVPAPFRVSAAAAQAGLGDSMGGYMTPLCAQDSGNMNGVVHQGSNLGGLPRNGILGPKENGPRIRVAVLPPQNVHAVVSDRQQPHQVPISVFRQNTCGELSTQASTTTPTVATSAAIRAPMSGEMSVPIPLGPAPPGVFRVGPSSTPQNNSRNGMHNGGIHNSGRHNGGIHNSGIHNSAMHNGAIRNGIRHGMNEQRAGDASVPVPPIGTDFNQVVRQQNGQPGVHDNCASRLNGARIPPPTLRANSNAVLAPMIQPAALWAPHFYSGRRTLPATMTVSP